MAAEIVKASPNDAGCWLEDARGWRAAAELVRIAWAYGMPHDDDDELIIQSYDESVTVVLSDGTKVGNGVNDSQDAADYVIGQAGMADNAEVWLNENVAPTGYSFGWHDGEFFLWSDLAWQDYDVLTDSRALDCVENFDEYDDLPSGWAYCPTCRRAWNDAAPTSVTPVPSARCPFELDLYGAEILTSDVRAVWRRAGRA